MRRTEARVALALVLTVVGSLVAPPAAAFWPFTRERPAWPDTTTQARIATRYEGFKVGNDSLVAAVAGVDSTDSTATATSPAGKTAGGQYVLRARDAAAAAAAAGAEKPPDSQSPAFGTPDSLAAAASPWSAPTDTLGALAGSDSVNAGPFAGLSGTGTTPPPDAAASAAAAAVALGRGFAPDFKSSLGSTNDNMRMSSDLSVIFTDPTGITLNSSSGYGVDLSLTQNTDQRTANLSNRIDMPLLQRSIRFGMSTSNSRVTSEGTRTINNTSTNTFIEARGGEASLSAGRRLADIPGLRSMWAELRGWSANLFYARRFSGRSQSTIALQGSGTGDTRHSDTGSSYGVGVAFDRFQWLTMRARAGTSRRDNKDRLSADQLEDAQSSSQGDTATVDVDLPKLGPVETVKLGLRINDGSDTTADPARSSTGSQTGAVGSYVLDTHKSRRESANLSMRYRQGPFTVGWSGDAGMNRDSYAIRANAFNETERYAWRVDSQVDLWKDVALVAKFDWTFSDVNMDDEGRANASTRVDKSRKLYVETSKSFTQTLKTKLYGEIQYDKSEYTHVGPQGQNDRDELRQRIGLDLSGAINKDLLAQAQLYWRTYDQAFIDPRLSRKSRDETEYVIRPSFAWTITPRVTMRQSFGLTSKVIEEVFNHERDTLNRNHYMRTEMEARLTSRLQMNLNWEYRIQDNGRFLSDPNTSERFYSPTLRTKTDGIRVGMRYAIISRDRLTFTSRQDSQRIYSFGFPNGNRTLRSISDSGNLALGFESRFQLKDLKLDCSVVRNRSFNVSLNREVFYDVDATLSYTF